ncbi:lactonase family protein [Ideonella livida]|uniref:Lactonase family protein n=1 Tax=Ideonella livida TaxID=2707176 RepID=A0A7C9TN73_9BURK|nr:lactonase family protein [Ideonella livida]NDY93205.1 lactonase family protein [Ideonella livida]
MPPPPPPHPHRRYAYVGCRTTRERNARGEGLSVFALDEQGTLRPVQQLRGLVNPSYLVLNRAGTRLYAVHGDQQEVSAFAVDRITGELHFLNQQDTQGRNPVHLALSPDEGVLVVVNHLGASLAVLPLDADGRLAPLAQLQPVQGPVGPHRAEQTQPKPHFVAFTPGGESLLVPDKGTDRVLCLRMRQGALLPRLLDQTGLRAGAGPRHLVHHPQQPWSYVVNELDSTVTACRREGAAGLLRPFQWHTTLPDDFLGDSRAAAIALDANGRTLYASNRGHDSIAVFEVDPASGRLRWRQAQSTGGRTPRAFTLSPCGRWLFALNEDSHTIARLPVDPATGTLGAPEAHTETGSPTCLVFAP